MPLEIENGTGKSNADSYISVTELTTYESAFGITGLPVDNDDLEVLCRKGSFGVDAHYKAQWRGVKKVHDQRLDWPRLDVYDDSGAYVDPDAVPAQVKDAACELAAVSNTTDITPLWAGNDPTTAVQTTKRTKAGPIETEKRYSEKAGGASGSVGSLPTSTRARSYVAELIQSAGGVELMRA